MVNWINHWVFDNRPRDYVVKKCIGITRIKKENEMKRKFISSVV